MTRVATGVVLAVTLLLLLFAQPVDAGAVRWPVDALDAPDGTDYRSQIDAGTANREESASNELPDFNTVWTAAVVAIGLLLIVGMLRTAKEHRFSANESGGRDVSKGG